VRTNVPSILPLQHWLNESNPQGRKVIEALTVHSRVMLTISSLLKNKKKIKKRNLKMIGGEGDETAM